MKPEFQSLEAKASVAVGAELVVERFRDKTVQIAGTFSATINLEGSMDGSAFATLAAAVAPGFYLVPQAVKYLRLNTTAFVSGVPSAFFGGFDSRSDGGA